MTISIDELVRQLATLGVVETAHNGSFHDLPGSGGGGSAARMVLVSVTDSPDPSPPGFGGATVTYGFDAPLTAIPFLQAQVQVVSDDYEYAVTVFPNPNGLEASVSVIATAFESADLALAFPVDVAVRIEPFVASA